MASDQARLDELIQTSQSVAAERSRKRKIARIAAYLRSLSSSEAAIAATWLSDELPQGRIGIGPSLLAQASKVPPGHPRCTTIAGLHQDLSEIVSSAPAEVLVLDGETLVLREDGRPQPFQRPCGASVVTGTSRGCAPSFP